MISVLDILYVSSDGYTIVHNNPLHSIVICEENPTCYVQEFQCKHPGAPQAWTRTQLMRCPRTSWHLCCACSHQQAAIWSGEWGGGKKMSGPWGLPKIDQFKFVHFRLFSGFKMFLDVLSHFKPTTWNFRRSPQLPIHRRQPTQGDRGARQLPSHLGDWWAATKQHVRVPGDCGRGDGNHVMFISLLMYFWGLWLGGWLIHADSHVLVCSKPGVLPHPNHHDIPTSSEARLSRWRFRCEPPTPWANHRAFASESWCHLDRSRRLRRMGDFWMERCGQNVGKWAEERMGWNKLERLDVSWCTPSEVFLLWDWSSSAGVFGEITNHSRS